MSVWQRSSLGSLVFTGGFENWRLAAQTARDCFNFVPDEEDEQISDDPCSCYNCRYRRWTADAFICLKRDSDYFNGGIQL
jgi:hypothetical protein